MKQIYCFDAIHPPVLNEKMLKTILEHRKVQRQAALLAVAGILITWCLIITAIMIWPVNIYISYACFAYACCAMCSGAVIAIIFTHKRRTLVWHIQ